MGLATVEETITVTGESPLVDVKGTTVVGKMTADLIDKTPTSSGLWAAVLDHIPGVVASFDVGGGNSGQQTAGVSAWGSEWRNNSYNVNGGDVTDPAAVGASSSYYSVSSFEEVSVSMAAQDIEIKTPGLNINMVIKSGSNDWHAGAKYFYENTSMVSDNVTGDPVLEEAGITIGTPNVMLSDLDLQGGGPIWRDRAWFFYDYWNFEVQKVILNLDEVDGTKLKRQHDKHQLPDQRQQQSFGPLGVDAEVSQQSRCEPVPSVHGPYSGLVQPHSTASVAVGHQPEHIRGYTLLRREVEFPDVSSLGAVW